MFLNSMISNNLDFNFYQLCFFPINHLYFRKYLCIHPLSGPPYLHLWSKAVGQNEEFLIWNPQCSGLESPEKE